MPGLKNNHIKKLALNNKKSQSLNLLLDVQEVCQNNSQIVNII